MSGISTGQRPTAILLRIARAASGLLIGLLLWLTMLLFPLVPAATTIDMSWRQALGEALKLRLQAGVDYIWTFGPLGYYYMSPYDAGLFWPKIAWELVLKLLMAVVFVAAARRLQSLVNRGIYFALLLLVIPTHGFDSLYLLFIVTLAILLLEQVGDDSAHDSLPDSPPRQPVPEPGTGRRSAAARPVAGRQSALLLPVAGMLVLALLSLVKFTFLMLSLLSVAALVAVAGRRRGLKSALVIAGSYGVFFLIIWLACGQSLINLPRYFSGSLRLSAGFSEALVSGEGELAICSRDPAWGGTILILLGLLILLGGLARPRGLPRLAGAGLLAAGLFLAWKNGLVRPMRHALIFFSFAPLVPFLVRRLERWTGWRFVAFTALRYLALLAALGGLFTAGQRVDFRASSLAGNWTRRVAANGERLLSLRMVKLRLERKRTRLQKEHRLPRIRKRVGEATVDIISHEQGVLFLNGFNWRPRPVFQSNLAYTPGLLAANAAFFRSSRAPKYVIFRLQSIDRRFKAMDDAEALRVIFRDYRPVIEERGYLLFRRQKQPAGEEPARHTRRLFRGEIGFGETLDFSRFTAEPQILALDLRDTLLGRLRKFFFRAPPVSLAMFTADGREYRRRIVPGMTRAGFLFSPLLRNQEEMLRWVSGGRTTRAVSLTVEITPGAEKYFRPAIGVLLEQDPALQPRLPGIRRPDAGS